VFPVAERVAMLAALEVVDFVHVFAEPTPVEAIQALRPDIHAKGADYANKPIPERAVVEAYGGRVELLPLVPGRSTTETLARLGVS
jgi:bifunctional ADP-heptose synthase (sugar kinase/adenylyltransferase)